MLEMLERQLTARAGIEHVDDRPPLFARIFQRKIESVSLLPVRSSFYFGNDYAERENLWTFLLRGGHWRGYGEIRERENDYRKEHRQHVPSITVVACG